MTTHRAHASADYAAGTNTAKCTCGWEQVRARLALVDAQLKGETA